MEISNLSDALNSLEEYWNTQGITINNSNSMEDIAVFEQKKGIFLPDDFKVYFQRINGMKLKYPMDFDEEGFLFYSLQQVNTLSDEFRLRGKRDMQIDGTKCLLFGEYMHKSWWYGVSIQDKPQSYSIGIIPEKTKFKKLSDNLTDFIRLYLNDSPEIYNYE